MFDNGQKCAHWGNWGKEIINFGQRRQIREMRKTRIFYFWPGVQTGGVVGKRKFRNFGGQFLKWGLIICSVLDRCLAYQRKWKGVGACDFYLVKE